ncbi:hypothetical protein BDV3_002163 [Batrachochytrium dendrobatidis]|uniref:DNA replication complex GINS protein SLD5 n=1 Tax=Batrachochytrium dendrobatidis (strain JEL423) TaxID=403673 RepID=A0A177WWD2_BATDL|nr:GINS complex subunit [Batrachochytrium dendrobatidis]KAK5664718.1 GINS complex subunit [Batrachochytrium dendrobatidis]OAJ43720.1 hypothetical protein BDEG_27051 [Batrachochytrium dendrobatidis JEL423]
MIGSDAELDEILNAGENIQPIQKPPAADIYQSMIRAWVNEKAAPDLLPFQHDLVSQLRFIVETQQEGVHLRYSGQPTFNFLKFIYGLELERIKFVLRSYIRLRLGKIQHMTIYLLSDPELRMCMSDEELFFAERFQTLIQTYHKGSYLGNLSKQWQALDSDEMLMKPDLDTAVFCRVTQDVGDLQINEMETILMKKDQMYLLRYSKVRPLVENNTVDLL